MRKINTKPFELVGMSYEDYQEWCNVSEKKEKDIKSKREFFEKVRHYEIFKKDGKLIMLGREN